MDSINQQQPEENKKDLTGREGIEKLKEMADKAKSCFFCTNTDKGLPLSARPMAPQKIDDEGNIWFLSADDSHKNAQINTDHDVQLFFQGSPYSDFLMLYGTASISRDKQKIEELWDPTIKTWFTGGKDDPRITVIRFIPKDGYYWDTKHGNLVAFAKQLVGAAIGQTLDDSIEGKISVS
jgi:general stress protein 26